MTDLEATTTTPKTLAQRLTEGRIPVTDGLRLAMMLADALRRIHDEGRVHGAVAPANIVFNGSTLELPPCALTPEAASYAAPEVLQGQPADARSDVFSFAAVLYEILTGRAPYQGHDRTTPMPTGSPAVDKLVAGCLALDPNGRPHRLQKVILELKLLAVAAARANAPAASRREDALRAEWQQFAARLAARVQSNEQVLADAQRVAAETAAGLHEQMSALSSQVAAAQERASQAEQSVEASGEKVVTRVLESTSAVIDRISRLEQQISALEQRESSEDRSRIEGLEQGCEGLRKQISELHDLVAQDMLSFEQSLKSQAVAIESARTAMAQTDDLVERVVEALESLQTTVLEHDNTHGATVN